MPSGTFNSAGIKVVKRIKKIPLYSSPVHISGSYPGVLSPLSHQSVSVVHVGLLLLGPPVLPLTGPPLSRALTHLIVRGEAILACHGSSLGRSHLGQLFLGVDVADLLVVALGEDDINFLQRATRSLRVEEVENRQEDGVEDGEETIGNLSE